MQCNALKIHNLKYLVHIHTLKGVGFLNAHHRCGNAILAFQTKPTDLNICGDQAKCKASIATSNAAAAVLLSIAKTC